MSSHYPQWSALFVRSNRELAASTQWAGDMMETGGCEECVRLIGVTGFTSGLAWNILYIIVMESNSESGLVNAGVIPKINKVMSRRGWEHRMGIDEMNKASGILKWVADYEIRMSMRSQERTPMWMLQGGGLNALWSLLEIDYSKKCDSAHSLDMKDIILDNCMIAVRCLYKVPAYRGPLNALRRRFTRNMPYSRFDALLDELQGGGA